MREAFQANMIHGDEWMEMLRIRNQLVHDYDGVIVKEHCQSIVQTYISKFEQFEEYVKKLLAEA